MVLLLVDKIGKTHGLDANELAVYSFIAYYSKKEGWHSSYAKMASLLPFNITTRTIERVVKKLTSLGLIERRSGVLFTTTNCPSAADKLSSKSRQNVINKPTNCPQNADKLSDIDNINNNKREEENISASDIIETPTPSTSSSDNFTVLLNAYKAHKGNIALPADKLTNCRELWDNKSPLEQQKLLQAVNDGKWFKNQLEWTISDFPMPQPKNYNGDMSVDVNQMAKTTPMVIARYNDKCGLYTLQEALDYQMEIKMDFIPTP